MVTTSIDLEKTVSDDHRRDTAKRGRPSRRWPRRRDPAGRQRHQEEGCDEQASPEGRIQPTRSCSSCQTSDLKSNGWRLTEFAKSLLLGARRKRATWQLPWKREVRRRSIWRASFVQLGATSESLWTEIRDLVGCVTIGSEIRSLGAEPNGDRVADASLWDRATKGLFTAADADWSTRGRGSVAGRAAQQSAPDPSKAWRCARQCPAARGWTGTSRLIWSEQQ